MSPPAMRACRRAPLIRLRLSSLRSLSLRCLPREGGRRLSHDLGSARQQELRRHSACGLLARDRRRLDHRPDRPERRRQVDAVQHHRRADAAGQRPGAARRPDVTGWPAAPAVPSRPRAHLPDRAGILAHDGDREPDGGAAASNRARTCCAPGSPGARCWTRKQCCATARARCWSSCA